MTKSTLEFHIPDNVWEESAPGAWVMVLAEDPGTSDRTLLQRYGAGFDGSQGPVLTHEYAEEVFVVTGELTDVTLGVTFGEGMYASRPPGMRHGPYTSPTGCLMFVTVTNAPS